MLFCTVAAPVYNPPRAHEGSLFFIFNSLKLKYNTCIHLLGLLSEITKWVASERNLFSRSAGD